MSPHELNFAPYCAAKKGNVPSALDVGGGQITADDLFTGIGELDKFQNNENRSLATTRPTRSGEGGKTRT